MEVILSRARSLNMAVGITARVIRALCGGGSGREGIRDLVTPDERMAARKLLLGVQQGEVRQQLQQGKLTSCQLDMSGEEAWNTGVW